MASHTPEPCDPNKQKLHRRQLVHNLLFGGLLTAGSVLVYQLGRQIGLALQPTLDPLETQPLETQPASGSGMTAVSTRQAGRPVLPPTATHAPTATATPDARQPSAVVTPADHVAAHPPIQRAARPAIIAQRDWGARKVSKAFVSQQPDRITLHHEGVIFDGSMTAPAYLRNVQRWSIDNRGWPDIPYHFMIDLEGLIYEGRPLDARGDTNTSYDLQGHALVAVLGKYDPGEQQPAAAQIDAIVSLSAWIVETYNMPPDSIHGHRDFIPVNPKGEHIDPKTGERITCPGDNLYRYLKDGTIQRRVASLLQLPYRSPFPQYISPIPYE